MNREIIRSIVRGAYDIQKLRIQMGNRIVANFKSKLGLEPSTKEDELDADGKKILNDLRGAYKLLTDGVKTFPRQATFKGNELISDYTELCLIAQYMELEKDEESHFRRLEGVLKSVPIYVQFLEGVKGIGPALAGVIVSEIDIRKAKYPSSLWAYAGLDVCDDGRGRSRRKEHLVERAYQDRDGKDATRVGITFNPFLKTKLIGVMGSSFLRAGDNKYSRMYRDYKNRLENHAVYGTANDEARKAEMKEKTGGKYAPTAHRHNMATRYMVKQFLVDLHMEWRRIEGLEVSVPYCEAKLGLHHKAA